MLPGNTIQSEDGPIRAAGNGKPNPWTDADVERHWDSVASIYRRENDRVKETHDQRFEFAVRHIDLFPGARILNISSRDAEAEDYLRRACGEIEVVHAEISNAMIAMARSFRPHAAQNKIESYARLPFAAASFDRILSLETLEHAADPSAFLGELHRVARPKARLVLSCPPATAELPYRIYTALFGGHGEGPHRFLPSRDVLRLLQNAGWDLVLHRGTLLAPVGPRWLRNFGERIIERFQGGLISEFGIRQFYVATRA